MINKILHTVTNRKHFVSPVFPASTGFIPATLGAAAEEVRQLLQLHRTEDDYFVVGVLQAIDAFPDIAQEFGEARRNYTLQAYRPTPLRMQGAELGGVGAGPPKVLRTPDTWPVDFRIKLEFVDSANLRARVGKAEEIFSAHPTGTDRLSPDWPDRLGIRGTLANLNPISWGEGFRAEIFHVPPSFPYALAAAALVESDAAYQLLSASGLEAAVYSARTPMEKIALTALAISRSHPAF